MAGRGSKGSRQLGLFGDDPVGRGQAPIGPAPVDPEWLEIAGKLPSELYLGTSSWSFPGWRGIVYDRAATTGRLAREGLAAYARHPLLRAAGIDRTFYAPLGAEEFAAYAEAVPEEFRFVVKAEQRCTTPWLRDSSGRPAADNALYLEPSWASDLVVAPYAEGLGSRAGALVFQFPPQGRRVTARPDAFAERLGRFLEGLPKSVDYAVELRDTELFTREYVEALRSGGATHCVAVHPNMPPVTEQVKRASAAMEDRLVVRWMLHSTLAYQEARERYAPFDRLVDEDPDTRESLATAATNWLNDGSRVLVIVNNKAEGSAPLSAFRLAEAIAQQNR